MQLFMSDATTEEELRTKIEAERAALGISPDTRTTPVRISVGKYGSRYVWALSHWMWNAPADMPEAPYGEAPTEAIAWREAEEAAGQFVRDCKGIRSIDIDRDGHEYAEALFGLMKDRAIYAVKSFQKRAREERKKRPSRGSKGAHATQHIIIERHHKPYMHRIIKETAKQLRYHINPDCNLDGTPAMFEHYDGRVTPLLYSSDDSVDSVECGIIAKAKAQADIERYGYFTINRDPFYYCSAWLTREQYDDFQARHYQFDASA